MSPSAKEPPWRECPIRPIGGIGYPFRLDPFLAFLGRAPAFWAAFSEISRLPRMTPETTRLSSKAQVVIPAERRQLSPLTLPSPPMGERDSKIVIRFFSSLSALGRGQGEGA